MGYAKCNSWFYFYRKEIDSLTQEQREVSLTIGQIMSPKNRMLDDRNCKEARYLLRIRYQYDCLIGERKALLALLDNQVRTSGLFPAEHGTAEQSHRVSPGAEKPRCKMHLVQVLEYNAVSWQKTHDNDKWIEPFKSAVLARKVRSDPQPCYPSLCSSSLMAHTCLGLSNIPLLSP